MTSRINSTPITLKTLKQQNDLASSQKVRFQTLVKFTDFAIYDLVSQAVDFTERQRMLLDPRLNTTVALTKLLVYEPQLLAFIVCLCRASNVSPPLILIKAPESDAAITQN